MSLRTKDEADLRNDVISVRYAIFYLVGKSGSRVIVPYRDEDDKRHLKIMGDLGQIIPLVRPTLPSPFLIYFHY
jgi:hypothetical protein